MKTLILWIMLLMYSTLGRAQFIYGVWEDAFNNYQFSRMDPTTAIKSSVAEIQSMSGIVAPNNTVIRADSNWYIVRVLMGTQYRLLTIDITSGDIESNVLFSGTFVGFEFNESNDSIYCIYHDGNSDYQLATVDHTTGNYNLYPAISGVSAYIGGTFALDKANGLYTFGAFTSSGYRLLSINISDGSIAYNNPFPTGLIGLEYNCQNDSLYAMQNISNAYYLISVSNVTGATNIIDTITGMNGYASYTASLDSWNHTYSCYGFIGSASKLIHLDLSTGASISSANISHNMSGWEGYETCNPPPTPDVEFEASDTSIHAGDTISFTDLSLFNPTSWNWQFQGATPNVSTSQNPTGILYPNAGCYAVTLIAANSQGADTAVKTCYIQVLDSVTANFEASDTILAVGDTIDFTDLSSNAPSGWDWLFFPGGSPGTSTLQHPSNIMYNTPGQYDVRLIASNSVNADTLVKSSYIHVYDQPLADFTADDTIILVGDSVHFTELCYGNIDSYSWNFQSGTPSASTQSHPTVIYPTAGCFSVTLTATNPEGSDSKTRTCYITVLDSAVESDFEADTLTILVGQSVNFTDLSTHNPTGWNWDFQGGSPATDTVQHPQGIIYNSVGCWDVRLNAYSSSGGDTAVKTCYISVEESVGMKDQGMPDISMRPNPASESINVFSPFPNTKLKVFAIDGSLIFRCSLMNGPNQIDLQHMNSGVYILMFEAGSYQKTLKLIKQDL